MGNIEVQPIEPEEMIREIENYVQRSRQDKYAFQVGLKDLDFEVDNEQLQTLGLAAPFTSLDQAEYALRVRAIQPHIFWEHDGTQHQVLVFDARPVGYSGFMDCVTHSLALTDQGLFEVGRYPAVSLSSQSKYWSWFLHRRLATPEEVTNWQVEKSLTSSEFVEQVYSILLEP